MAEELGEGVGDEEGVWKSCMAEGSGWKGRRLDDERGRRKEMRVGAEGERDSAELRCKGEPSNSAVREE